jgi:hypothetical protein
MKRSIPIGYLVFLSLVLVAALPSAAQIAAPIEPDPPPLASTGLAQGAVEIDPLTTAQEPLKPKSAVWPVVLNLVPGFGVGSFVEGDRLGGFVCLGGDIAGVGLCGTGIVMFYVGIAGAAAGQASAAIFTLGHAEADTSEMESMAVTGLYLAIAGGCVWICSKVFGIIRPICYAKKYNSEHSIEEASLIPVLRPAAHEEGQSSSRGARLEPGLCLSIAF